MERDTSKNNRKLLPPNDLTGKFDSNVHEAVAIASDKHSKPGAVIDELRRSYLRNEQLLRAAHIRVAGS
ncbi:MAG TPA: nucleotide exchange factor GrpE [Bacteroidota bacterium]|nr:nucleotide exchange factor GrpE [Bacteroidota bacterium]